MDNQRESKLIAEYQVNVELWKHDDSLRQQRQNNFLTVNTILFVGLGAVTGFKPPMLHLGAIMFLFSIFGLLLSIIWHKVQVRNAEYVRFRRFQLQHIESKLGDVDTFTNTYHAFYDNKGIDFGDKIEPFVLSEQAQQRSTLTEGKLPTLLGLFWTVAGVAGIFLVITHNMLLQWLKGSF